MDQLRKLTVNFHQDLAKESAKHSRKITEANEEFEKNKAKITIKYEGKKAKLEGKF